MIYNLRKKFIIISAVAVSVVFALIFGMIYIASTSQLNHTMDMLTKIQKSIRIFMYQCLQIKARL